MKKITLIIVALSFLLGACISDLETNSDSEDNELNFLISEPGTVVLPLTKYNTLNPLINENVSYFYLSKLIFEGLFDLDENLQPIPKLAETYTIDSQGKVTIKLREDVLWHDGQKFTARDVKFTIEALRLGNENVYSQMINSSIYPNRISSINVIDEFNLEINFDKLSPHILGLLTFPIVPEHGFEYMGAALDEDFTPIGTGPFIFNTDSRTKDIELMANENYRFEKPRINKIVGKVLDNDLAITSFEAGQIDIAITSNLEWDRFKQSSGSNVIEFISSDYEFLGFNFNNEILSGDKGKLIRKAIAYGINIQNIIENIYSGHGSQVDLPIHPNSYYSNNINSYGYNPEKSKEYLNRAGFSLLSDDGILMDENGNKLVFRYLTNQSNINRRRTAELIKEDLNHIGIELVLEYETVVNEDEWEIINEKVENSEFDMVQLGLKMPVIPDIGQLFHTEGNTNFINYTNEAMDSLIIDYESKSIEDIANENLQKHVIDELPYVSLFYTNKALLINSKIIGELKPTYYNPYNGLENCFTTIKGH